MSGSSFPGLSELVSWPTEHLVGAAQRWTAAADRWTEVFGQVWQDSVSVDWQADAADALRNRTTMDRAKVNGLSEQLYDAARVARGGASGLEAASSRVRYAVQDARQAGFRVGQDLSVTDRYSGLPAAQRVARQAQARAFAGDIHQRATQLVELDQQVAGRIGGALSGVGGVSFPEAPVAPMDDHFRAGPDFGHGDMKGDIEDVDRRNRAVLDELEQEYRNLPDGQIKTDRLADIAALREALTVPDSHLLFIDKPADPSQMIPAATSIGDPFKADHVSVTVPGVSSTTRGAIATMTREAYGLRQEAQDVAAKVGESTNVSTIAWVGYQPPPVITSSDTLSDGLAQAGAPKLESFLQNLDAASRNPNHSVALFGHSYGSLVSGIALSHGASSVVDNAVLYGSPGFEATSPAKLGMNDHNFFVMSTPDDPIRPVGAIAPLHGWGSDPNEVIHQFGHPDRYRFTHLQTGEGWVDLAGERIHKTGAQGHGGYPHNPTEQMTGFNLAAVLLDRPDLAVRAGPP